LILENLPHVRWVAMRIHEKIGGAVSLEDLVSSGVIGLINAVDSYDPKFNVKLKTYAEHRIRGAILDSIRGLDGIPVHKRKRLKDVEAAIASAEQRLQRVPSEEEIAAEMSIPLAEYQELLAELRGVSLGSLDEIADGFSESKLLRYVAHDEENLPTRILERAELEKLLAEAVNKMPRLERTILTLYFKEEQNLHEIAEILGIHTTRVCQLKSQAVLRLRAYVRQEMAVHPRDSLDARSKKSSTRITSRPEAALGRRCPTKRTQRRGLQDSRPPAAVLASRASADGREVAHPRSPGAHPALPPRHCAARKAAPWWNWTVPRTTRWRSS
jgi:RNA polymerase sigma factor for flagellar operon FliA